MLTREQKMKRQRAKAVKWFLKNWDADHGPGRFATPEIRAAERAHDKYNFQFGWASAEMARSNIR